MSVEFERRAWAAIEDNARRQGESGKARLKVFLEVFSYDGVDLRLGTRAKPGQVGEFDVPAVADDEGAGDAVAAEVRAYIDTQPNEKDVALSKLLNSQHSVLMMFDVGGKNLVLQGESMTWVQSLDRNTAENLRAAVEELSMSSSLTRAAFARRVRLAITDAAGYNIRAERNARDDGTLLIHLLCSAHVLAGIHNEVYAFGALTVSRVQKTAASLQGGGEMRRLRTAMRKVIARSLVLIHQAPDDGALAYKHMLLDMFLGTDFRHAHLRAVVSRCASGDWRRTDRFEYLVTGDETRVQVLKLLFEHFVPTLCAHAPRTFPRSRWTGAELALADVGMMAGIHGLLQRTYQTYMTTNFPTAAKKTGAPEGGEDEGGNPFAVAIPDAAGGEPTAPPSEYSAEAQRHNRGVAVGWVSSPFVLRDLATMAHVLQPMHRYMCKEIEMSSALWTTAQASACIERLQDEGDVRTFFEGSSWPVLIAASGDLDSSCLGQIADAHDPARYDPWPHGWKAMDTRNTLFRMFSRQGAAVKEFLVTKHRSCLYTLFRLLVDPSADMQLRATCEPIRDEYTASFMEAYNDNLTSADALLELAMVVMSARTSTVHLESSNATLRRRLVLASTQVTKPELHTLSAEFLLGKLRRRQFEAKFPAGHRRHWDKSHHPKKETPKKRGGGGGAWRAFLRKKRMNIANPALSREYHALSHAEKAALVQSGSVAMMAHRYGLPSFGHRNRATA